MRLLPLVLVIGTVGKIFVPFFLLSLSVQIAFPLQLSASAQRAPEIPVINIPDFFTDLSLPLNMTAFVPASAWISGTTLMPSKCNRFSSARIARRSRILRMIAEPEDETKPTTAMQPESQPETPPEPYPGFFADMKRMGLTEEQAYAQAKKAQKQKNPVISDKVGGAKNLFKPDGTPYAPWMAGISAEYDTTVIKKRTDATGRLAADPQSAELSGVGISWKMLGDELELKWATGAEEGNRGFVVYRRPGKSDKWDKVADYRDVPAELISKGPEGGSYSFIVTDPQPGSWVYRVSDVDENNNVSDLSQVLVEIESAEDSKIRKIALVFLLIVLGLAVAAGISLDPLSSA